MQEEESRKYVDLKLFGKCIELKRKQLKMTQTQLAKLIGVSPPTMHLYETGNREPDLNKLVSLCVHLETSIENLLGIDQGSLIGGYTIVGNDGTSDNFGVTIEEIQEDINYIDDVWFYYKDLNEEGKQLLKKFMRFLKSEYSWDKKKEEVDDQGISVDDLPFGNDVDSNWDDKLKMHITSVSIKDNKTEKKKNN